MPRPKKEGAPEPKKRSRNGCWPCKTRKVKCGEEKPRCLNCERQGETCDYSIRLNWGGRSKKDNDGSDTLSFTSSPHSSIFPTPEALIGSPAPSSTYSEPGTRPRSHTRTHSNLSLPPEEPQIDPPLYPTSAGPTSNPANNGFSQEQGGFRDSGGLSLEALRQPHQNLRDITSAPIDPRIETLGLRGSPNYPSSASALQSPGFDEIAGGLGSSFDRSNTPSSSLLPPFSSISAADSPSAQSGNSDFYEPVEHHAKRMRLSTGNEPSAIPHFAPTPEDSIAFGYDTNLLQPGANISFNFAPTPLTPGTGMDEIVLASVPQQPQPAQSQAPDQPRKLSVNDLLSAPPPDDMLTPQTPDSWPTHDVDTTAYGYDLGRPDEDIPNNNDVEAIRVMGSPEARRLPYPASGFFADDGEDDDESKDRPIAFNRGGYYVKPVAIRIPKALEPLPNKLLESPMNLLYFHHFLNHTARILVPHDCEQNPFRNVLPQLAVQDENILNLMLAYSASHRARLLQHPEPANRIAEYVQDVFPKLRQALSSTAEQVSTTNLASAIMLASLEIMSPNTFEVPVSWQNHLTIARNMIFARGGAQSVHKKDKASYFLSRWFAYLDVLGSLSGSKNDWPLSSNYWCNDDGEIEDEFEIDCLLGFTSRCVSILARIAELAKSCEKERIDEDGNVKSEWRPSGSVVTQAERLKVQLQEGRAHVTQACTHRRANISESELAWDGLEIYATNEAFHWAGLIHLTRRVLGRPSGDPEVQNAVREIIGALYKVRRGSTAESCLLFPMFTAGCDALDKGQRGKIMERLRSVEAYGMTHVKKARRLMEKVWDTGKPWESLVSDEFFG